VTQVVFLWDERPGSNVDHIRSHGMTTGLWEAVFHHARNQAPDKDDASVIVAEGRSNGRLFRIAYSVDGDTVIPLTIIPITGFPITRRGLRGSTP
jgi:hypothetical protein